MILPLDEFDFPTVIPETIMGDAQDIHYGSHALQVDNNLSWLKIHLDPGLLSSTMTPKDNVDINMELYNNAGQIVAANFSSGVETIEYRAQIAGDYFLKFYPTVESSAVFSLQLSNQIVHANDDSYDTSEQGNDTFNTAIDFSNQTILDIKDQIALDDDWYKLSVLPGTFSIDVPDNLNIEVYDSAKNRIADSTVGLSTVNIQVLSKDIYSIVVSGGNGQSYDLNAGTETVWATELDFGPIRDVPVTLFDIDQDGKDEIFIATSKKLDADFNEIRPAGLVVLEDDGSIKWTTTFAAMSTIDIQTGKQYQTSSVSTAPTFSDLDNDGSFDLVIGVGGDTAGEAGETVVGQPGDKGGVYALDEYGNIKWFHESLDIIGGDANIGDNRPDGVYGAPVIFDIDKDGIKDVIYNGWDQHTWILDARDGTEKVRVNMADTIWSTPRIADLDEDGQSEILVSADITTNIDAGTSTGGIFHVVSADGSQKTAGFDQPVGNPTYTTLRGKTEEQTLWSSPVTGDLDGDGHLEIVYGTGNFFHDDRGSYIKVWNHDGSLNLQLGTVGRTFATPLITDLDGDGDQEIIATTLEGYIFAWDHTGNQLFATATTSIGASTAQPIFSTPLSVDLTGDGKKEIIYSQGAQTIVVDYLGNQLTDKDQRSLVFESYKGTAAIKDIDNDGKLDIISGGQASDSDKAVVYRWNNPFNDGNSSNFINDRYQVNQSTTNINDFVERFYSTVLGREAEAGGRLYWTDSLCTGTRTGADVARGFIFSEEFSNRNLSDEDYVRTLYTSFFDRSADEAGFNGWMSKLSSGADKASVLDGFIFSQEFKNLTNSYSIVAV
jgi:hypothetical protein